MSPPPPSDPPGSAFPTRVWITFTTDLRDPPPDWHAGFDLVVEIFTVQALPEPYHQDASHNVGRMVAPGGRLIVIAAVRVEDLATGEQPFARCWRAEFHRPSEPAT